jgi:hypothetical protein
MMYFSRRTESSTTLTLALIYNLVTRLELTWLVFWSMSLRPYALLI